MEENVDEVKEALRRLYERRYDYKLIKSIAIWAYNDKFKDLDRQKGTYHGYDRFEILDANTIRVHYVYGASYGDADYADSFVFRIEEYGTER